MTHTVPPHTAPVSRAQRKQLSLVFTFSFALGLLYVFLIRPGLPYDEPAHWNNVAQYARGHFLPVMGAPGVSYEAYQGPFFYVWAALVSRLSGLMGETFAFYFLRVASLALLIPITALCYATARRVFTRNSHAMALLVAIFVGWNPVLLAISSSVQNDSTAILLSTLVIFLCVQKFAGAETPISSTQTSSTRSSNWLTARDALLLGVLVGLAVLCKLTNAYLIFAVPLAPWLARRDEKPRFGEWLQFALIFVVTVALTTGWWFAHNRALYGDFTGTSAMKRLFPAGTGTPVDFTRPGNWFHAARSILNYWWLNAEYFRNLVEAPKLAKIALLFMTALAFLGFACRRIQSEPRDANMDDTNTDDTTQRRGETASRIIALFYGVCVVVYLRGIATQWFFPARMTLVTIVAPAIFLVGAVSLLQRVRPLAARAPRVYGVLLAAILVFINLSMLRKTTQLPPFPFDMTFSTLSFPAHSEALTVAAQTPATR